MVGIFSYADSFKKAFNNHCIELFVDAYKSSIVNKNFSVDWNENDITSILNNYIKKNPNRRKWGITNTREEYLFNEDSLKVKGFADSENRIDMKMSSINSEIEYIFYIEAKRLKENDSQLLNRYITTGIDSFVSHKYEIGFLAAYLVYGSLPITISKLNSILRKVNRPSEVLIKKNCLLHDEYYESVHKGIGVLKHFVFDFTK